MFRGLLFLVVMVLLQVQAAHAQVPLSGVQDSQQTTEVPEDLYPAEVRDLVSTLSDEEVRRILLQRLDAVAEQKAAQDGETQSFPEFVTGLAEGIGISDIEAVERLPRLVTTQGSAFANFYEARGTRHGARPGWASFLAC